MPLATTSYMQELLGRAIRDHMRRQEALIRELLGRWVSELEPEIIYDYDGQVAGIGMARDPEGRIIVEAPGRTRGRYASRGILDLIYPRPSV